MIRRKSGKAPSPHKTSRMDGRRSGGEGAIHGLNSVEAALSARRRTLKALNLKTGDLSPRLSHLKSLARGLKIPVTQMAPAELDKIAGSSQHQGAVLRCGPLPVLEEKEAWAVGEGWSPGENKPPPLLVALDQVNDPRNLGAIVRACAAFGARGLVLPRDHSAPLSAAASSASAGALEAFPVFGSANLARFLAAAKSHGFWVAGAVAEGGSPLPEFQADQPLVLVMGSEDKGLRALVERQCDHLLTIPLPGSGRAITEPSAGNNPAKSSNNKEASLLDSLNVASAAAVLLYALTTKPQRG